MAIKLTVQSLSSITGISEDELIKRLKESGIEANEDQELTPAQAKLLKDSIKNRQKMSIESASTKPNTKSNQSTVIKRIKKGTSSTTELAFKKPIKTIKTVELKKKSKTVKPEPKIEEEKVETPKEEIIQEDTQPIISKPVIQSKVSEVALGSNTTLQEIAQKTCLTETELTQAFFNHGYMLKKNDPIDFDTAALLLDTLGVTVTESIIEKENSPQVRSTGKAEPRPPIVTIMGHVDHGKTSLLDYIRSTKIAAKEAGGITQHVATYQVNTNKGPITFMDTPGHEAFSAMRNRGANITDIIILIVAANDGVKPQTIESIQHAKNTNTPIIVAITKIDTADKGRVDAVLGELSNHNIVVESWGGDIAMVEVSSKTGQGIEELLEAILLQAEVMELKAPFDGEKRAFVIESHIDRGRGPITTMIVEEGTFKIGDILTIGAGCGKIRTMSDTSGKRIKQAQPAMPIEITGISPLPNTGDIAVHHPDEKTARLKAEKFAHEKSSGNVSHALAIEDLLQQKNDKYHLSIILKADTQGTLEAIQSILDTIDIEDTELKIVDQQVGSINPSDVLLAANTNAHIVAFNVNIESTAKKLIEQHSVSANQFKVIYQIIDFVKDKMNRLKGPIYIEKNIGFAHVKAVFRSSKFGQIAGCLVSDGIIKRGAMIRVKRAGENIFEGELASVRREKETLTEARKGSECGLGIKGFSDAKVDDIIECYTLEEDV